MIEDKLKKAIKKALIKAIDDGKNKDRYHDRIFVYVDKNDEPQVSDWFHDRYPDSTKMRAFKDGRVLINFPPGGHIKTNTQEFNDYLKYCVKWVMDNEAGKPNNILF